MKNRVLGFKQLGRLFLLLCLMALWPALAGAKSISQAHNLFVANIGNGNSDGSITEIATNGTQYLFATNLDFPYGIVFDNNGDLFVADYGANTIYEYTNGYQLGQAPIVFASNLDGPIGLAMDGQGDLFEADGGSGSIYEFTNGYTPGQSPVVFASNLASPISLTGLAFDRFGNLFAGNDGSGTIFEFPIGYQSGQTPVTFADNLFAPTGLAFDQFGNLFVTDGDGALYSYATNGAQTVVNSTLDSPAGIAFDGFGNLYEGDFGSGNVYYFMTNGTQNTFATGLNPTFVAFDPVSVIPTSLFEYSTANPSAFGQSVTLTATIDPAVPGVSAPTGTVAFFDGAANLGTVVVSNEMATLTITGWSVGIHNLQLNYSGDANFMASSTTTNQTVVPAATTNILTVTPNPSVYGQLVTLMSTVTAVAPGAGTVGGSVTFYDGSTNLGTSTLSNGVATLAISNLLAGSHSLTATYAVITPLLVEDHGVTKNYAGGNYSSSTSLPTVLIVNQASTMVVAQSSSNPTVFGQPVTFTATVNAVAPGVGTPTGTVNFSDGGTGLGSGTLNNGVATLTISSLSVGIHSIQMSYSGDANFAVSSGMTNQLVNLANTVNTLTVVPNPSVYGQPATLTASVTVVEPGTGTVAGNVTFYDGATSLGASTLNNGVAALTIASLGAGTHSLTAVYGSNGSFSNSVSAPATLTINQAGTTTAAQTSLTPTVYGQSVTFTATVTSAVLPPTPPPTQIPSVPTGSVNFFDGAANLGSGTLSNGMATFTVSSLSPGSHNILMVYSGDANFLTSSGPLNQTVNQAATTVALVTAPNTTRFGQVATLTATVTTVAPGTGTADGLVTFFDEVTNLGSSTLSNGTAVLNFSGLPTGNHSLTAVYAGSTNYSGSTSLAVPQGVFRAFTMTAEQTSVNPSVFGQSVTFTATLGAVSPGAGTPTGIINFFDGVSLLGTTSLTNGAATLAVSSLTAGMHRIAMDYLGDSNFLTSSNFTLQQLVNPAGTTNVLTVAPNPTVYGQPATLTATVTAIAPGAGTVGGNVTFYDGGTNLGTSLLNNGVAIWTVSSLLAGNHNLTAVYAGSSSFSNSVSSTIPLTVNQAATMTAFQASLNPTVFGQAVTFTATISAVEPGAGVPTGTVNFSDGTTNLGTGTVSNGVATLTVSSLSVGTHNISMNYSGDENFLSSGNSVNQMVNQAATVNILAIAPSSTVFGQPLTLTSTITAIAPGTGIPDGSVTFYANGSVEGVSSLSNGVAVLTITNLLAGPNTLSAVYSGSASFTGSSSIPAMQMVSQAGTTLAVQSSANPSVLGQSVTFTAALSAVAPGAGTPTGTVSFSDGTTSLGAGTLNNGVATLTVSSLAVGAHAIGMSYSGDSNFLISSNSLSQVVNPAGTTNVLTLAPNPSVYGQMATLTATVTIVAPGAGTVAGNVTFFDGATSLGGGALSSGVATLNISNLLAGNHPLTAVYTSNGSYSNSTSLVETQVVNQASTTNMVVSDINPSVPGLPVVYTASVSVVAPGAGVPTGSVIFYYNGTNSFGTNLLVAGTTSVTNAFLPVGSNLVTAVYSGDANFSTSTSLVLTQTVISLTSPQALGVGSVQHSGTIFLQSGLMLQYFTVSNVTAGTYSALQMTLHLTQPGITVYDATGTNANGDAYLWYNYPIPPYGSVTFAVEYYVVNRTTIPNPTVSVTLVSPQTPMPVPDGTVQPIVQHQSLSVPNAFLVGFQTQTNATYYVTYSTNMTSWIVVLPPVKGNGSEIQWLDLGPPLTVSPPNIDAERCYKIIKAQ